MKEQEKQLLLKDLCGRLPHNVKCSVYDGDVKIDGVLCNHKRLTDEMVLFGLSDKVYNPPDKYYQPKARYRFENIKPYLRPMSSMTEEEKAYYDTITFTENEHFIGVLCGGVVDWLNAHYFDYRGLIEKGLALEAPDGMYSNN